VKVGFYLKRLAGAFPGVLAAALGAVAPAFLFAEDDAVSYDERLTEEGDEADRAEAADFAGDFRFRIREVQPPGATFQDAPPDFRHNTYLYSRTRISRGPVAGGVLAKRAAVGPAVSYENLRDLGTLKSSLELRDVGPVARGILGDYTLVFGQGLLFYDGFGEFVRPAKVRDRGPRPDFTTSPDDTFRGGAARLDFGLWGLDAFTSHKALDFPLNPDGTVDFNLDGFHDAPGDAQTDADLLNNNSVSENFTGARLFVRAGRAKFGFSRYAAKFGRPFDPADREFSNARAFRGDRLGLIGTDVDIAGGNWDFSGEAARSRSEGPLQKTITGTAWTATLLRRMGPSRVWLSLFDYDAEFLSPHGKPNTFAVSGGPESLPRNQTGVLAGGEFSAGEWKGRLNATAARFPEALGDGSNTGPLHTSQGRFLLADQRLGLGPGAEFRLYCSDQQVEKRLEDVSGVLRQVTETTRRLRATVQWRAGPRVQATLRREVREERVKAFGEKATGRMWVADAVFSPTRTTTLKVRTYFFDSRDAFLTTGPEEIWDGVVYPRLAGNLGSLRGAPGTRMYAIVRQTLGKHGRLWMKLEITRRPETAEGRAGEPSPPRRAWHVQWDERWGGT